MHFYIIAVRHKAPTWIECGIAEYQKRLSNKLTDIAVKPSFRTTNQSSQAIKSIEAKRIRTIIHREHIQQVVLMDEAGQSISTKTLATQIRTWHNNSAHHGRVGFVIGGADGIDASLQQEVDKQWSLSCMTFPHHLARLILVEQLYRAMTLIEGHPYHHA